MNVWRIIVWSLVGLAAGIAEAVLRSFLPMPYAAMYPVIPLAILRLHADAPAEAIAVGFVGGLVTDLFHVGPALFVSGAYTVVLILAAALTITFLTKQSIYSALALDVLTRALIFIWTLLAAFGDRLLLRTDVALPSLANLPIIVLWDVLIVSVGVAYHAFRHRKRADRRYV